MVFIQPTFEKKSSGIVTFSGTEQWVNLLSYGPDINSPIPSGQQIWSMFCVCITQSKGAIFELRSNLSTKSAGTIEDTILEGVTKVGIDDSKELDVYYNGGIMTKTPSTASTGVETLWLRIKTGSASAATYEFIHYYTII